jgi:hypothetical protein
MESSFVSFVNKPYRLCFHFCFGGVVLCSVYFRPFSASYRLPFIFAVIFCFFLAYSRHSLRLLTSVIYTCIVMYWWYHVKLHWCIVIVCGTCWPDVGCNIGYGTRGLFITGCHCALAC